jgi:hypothetical protein
MYSSAVERLPCKQLVMGSNPITSFFFIFINFFIKRFITFLNLKKNLNLPSKKERNFDN